MEVELIYKPNPPRRVDLLGENAIHVGVSRYGTMARVHEISFEVSVFVGMQRF